MEHTHGVPPVLSSTPSSPRCTYVVPTTSPALVSVSQLGTTTATSEAIPVVRKSYLRRDVAKHGLCAAVHAERVGLARVSTRRSARVPRLLAALADERMLTLVMYKMPGIAADALPRPLALSRVARVVAGLAHALQVVHTADVVHGDVVARNVLVDAGAADAVCLIDFGSCFVHSDGDGQGDVVRDASVGSTPLVLPPEVRTAATACGLNPLADVWALGLFAWSLLVPSEQASILQCFVAGKVSLRDAFWSACPPYGHADASPDCWPLAFDFISTCLHLDPAQRFSTVANTNDIVAVPWPTMVDYKALNEHPFLLYFSN